MIAQLLCCSLKSVKWKCWRQANCTEYDEDAVSGVSGEAEGGGGGGGEGGSEGNEEDHCHDGKTQEL